MAKRKRKRKPRSQEPEPVRRDGALCAAFVNTATARRKPLATYADALAWGEACGALSAAAARRLGRVAAERPADAAAAVGRFEEARALAERILGALAENRHPAVADLKAFNALLGAALSARRLVRVGDDYEWSWSDGDELDRVLWPVLVSVGDLLASELRRKVRRCGAEDCRVLFVDRTGGSPRKWCSRKTCGHRTRALKYYHAKVKPRRRRRRKEKLERANRELRRREDSRAAEEASS